MATTTEGTLGQVVTETSSKVAATDNSCASTTSVTATAAPTTTSASTSGGFSFVVTPENVPKKYINDWGSRETGTTAQKLAPRESYGPNDVQPSIVRGSIANPDIEELFSANRLTPCSNGLVDTIVECYNYHHNLVLRPDDIWMAIVSQFSFYLNANAERLRSSFVSHSGQKELVVFGSGTLYTAAYENLCNMMSVEIEKNLVDPTVREWIIPGFTTTTFTDKVVGAAMLMSAMQKYFSYRMCLECGIPKVTLLGTPEDWIALKQRAQKLSTYGLEKWVAFLNPVLTEFISASEGHPNIPFWQRICHYTPTGSGPVYLSGWVTVFCVFTDKGLWQADNTSIEIWTGKTLTNDWPIIDTNDVPPGWVSTPVTVDDNGTVYKTTLWSGSFVREWSPDMTEAHPRLDWLLTLNNTPEEPAKTKSSADGCVLL
ncbi:CDP-alcohol phosphatidyltransferase [Pelomyxa schiedti]|nr:CDP-alcohol phosphatidyltransferase [Pelomyxa schiedti]